MIVVCDHVRARYAAHMVELTADAIRKRPGMYCGGIDGTGVGNLVLELLANAHDQYLTGRCSRIRIAIEADGTTTVEDDGPGLPAHGGGGLPPLEHLLTRHSTQPTVDGHRPHAHHGLGGLGLFVVNALSERLELVTVHAGAEARIACVRGAIVEPVAVMPTQRASGTTVRFRPAARSSGMSARRAPR